MDKDLKLVVEKLIKKVYLLNLKRHKKQKYHLLYNIIDEVKIVLKVYVVISLIGQFFDWHFLVLTENIYILNASGLTICM